MKIINIFKAEAKKYFLEIKAYYPDHIVSLIVTLIFFIGFFMGMSSESGQYLYIGFFYWFLASIVISEGSESISYEKQTGTFEQLNLKPVSLFVVLMVRTTIWLIISFLKILLLSPFIILFLDIEIILNWEMLLILIISLIGIYGFGLILSSLTLLFTKTASFESIITYLLLFFSGAIIPVMSMPRVVQILSKLLPLTFGIELSIKSISSSVLLYDYLSLVISSSVYLLLGMMIFIIAQKRGRKVGYSSLY